MSFRAKSRNLNKMKRIIYILAICASGLTSCTKFLDIKPYGQTIPKTADEFSSLLNTTLEAIDYGEEVIIGNVSSIVNLESYADDLEANLTSYPLGNYIALYVGDHISSKQTRYGDLYESIRDCNIIIDNLEEKDTRLGKDVLGTAHAIRGICYYNLLRDFCEPPVGNLQGHGVPMVIKFDMEGRPLRSTIQVTVAQIESDFNAAITYGIEDPMYRFNSDIMEGYLARLYFWVGDWANAVKYARLVIGKYPLMSGDAYLNMMQTASMRNSNILFIGGALSDANSNQASASSIRVLSSRPVSVSFIRLFAEEEKDVRYALSFNKKREFKKNLMSCIRSAEMQLILAESLYHQKDYTGALTALNELRRNRIEGTADYSMETLPPVDESARITVDVYGEPLTPLLNAILNERRKELFLEGDRWYELKRNGRPEFWAAKDGYKRTTRKFMYTFPLPIQDVELVDGLVQNPGYDKVQ